MTPNTIAVKTLQPILQGMAKSTTSMLQQQASATCTTISRITTLKNMWNVTQITIGQ